MRLHTSISAAVMALCIAGGANAQTAASEIEALRAEQTEIFAEMFAAPDDVDLMLKYALVSVRLEDYEAAITTLERILIYRPDFARVKLELGASYFRIGSYPVARFYFDEVAADANASADMKAKSAEFIEEIERRTQKNYITGKVSLAGVFTTNANNGPDSNEFRINDLNAFIVGANVGDESDVGATFTAQLSLFNDLDNASGDQWRTDLVFLTTKYSKVDEGDIAALVLRTGPKLSVDDDRFGVKVRPYIEMDHVRYGDEALQSSFGVGAEVTNTIDQTMSAFGDAKLSYRDHHQPALAPALFQSDLDGLNFRAKAGVNYFYSNELLLTGQIMGDYESVSDQADTAANDASDSFELGMKGIARFFYDSEFEQASRRWMLTGEAQVNYRGFSDGAFGNTESRDDIEFRVGLANTAYFSGGWALVTEVDYFVRGSNYPQFDMDALSVSIGAEYKF